MDQNQQTPLDPQETQVEETITTTLSEPSNNEPSNDDAIAAPYPPEPQVAPPNGTSSLIKIGLPILALIIAGVCFYFFYWIRTPEYSLNVIRNSVQQNDLITFEKHVDLNSSISSAFDSLIEAQLELDPPENPQFVKGMVTFLKPTIVTTLKEYVLKEVGTPKEKKKDVTPSTPTNKKDKIAEDFSKKAGLDSMEFKGFGSTKTEGNLSLVEVKITDKELKKDFTLVLKMSKLEDGKWKLIGVDNLKQYLIEYTKAKQGK